MAVATVTECVTVTAVSVVPRGVGERSQEVSLPEASPNSPRAGPGSCGNRAQETLRAWRRLSRWIAGAPNQASVLIQKCAAGSPKADADLDLKAVEEGPMEDIPCKAAVAGGVARAFGEEALPSSRVDRWRHCKVIGFASTAAFACFYNRSVLSVVISQVGGELGLMPAERAKALSSFFYGYMVSNIAAGPLLQRFHPKNLLLFAVFCSSLCTLMLPAAIGAAGQRGLLACRLLSGLTQGCLYPSAYGLFGVELGNDPVMKTRALAMLGGVAHFGTAISFMVSPVLQGIGGWRLAVEMAGCLGLPWCLVWVASSVYRVPPVGQIKEQESAETPPESEKPCGGAPAPAAVPYRAILSAAPFRAIVCGHFAHQWANAVIMAWLPTYLSQQLHVSGKSLGVGALPYLAMAFSSPLGGELADRLLRRRWDLWTVRRTLAAGGLLLPALGLFIFPFIDEEIWPAAIACVTLVMAFSTWVNSSVLASPLDLAGSRLSGTLFAITNGICAAPCFVGIEVVGFLRENFGWVSAFGLCSIIYVTACCIYVRYGSTRRIFD